MSELSLETIYERAHALPLEWVVEPVYMEVKDEVERTPFRSPEGKKDWEGLKEWVTKATGDNRTNPGAEKVADLIDAVKNTIRRILARRRGMTSTQSDVDPMVPEEELEQTQQASASGVNWYTAATGQDMPRLGGAKRKSQTAKFCRCIKQVRKTIRPRKGSTKESAAIGVCVRSVLHSRGRTVKRFKCGKTSRLVTQKRK